MPLSALTIFIAGFITILSPCILPILPPFLAGSIQQSKWKPVFITIGMMFGFTLVGVGITVFGRALGLNVFDFRKIAIVLLFIFGLGLLFPQYASLAIGRMEFYFRSFFSKKTFEQKELPKELVEGLTEPKKNNGIVSGFFTGMGLGFAWIPCIGPVFGAVLTFAASRQSLPLSIFYFFIYSLGAGIPMLLLAFFSNKLITRFRWLSEKAESMKRIAGVILIIVAISFIFNWDRIAQNWILQYYPNFAL